MFDIEKHAGVGRVGAEILDGLVKRGYDVVTMASNNTSHLSYLKYLLYDIPRNLPSADVYISQSPMESIWLPKERTICMVNDLIPLAHPELAGAHMNGNPIKTFLGSRFYWYGVHQAAKCKRLITISDLAKDDLLKCYHKINSQKVKTINLGVRPDLEYRPKQDNIFRIGYLGQLDKRKRVNLLIDAFKDTAIDGELVIAGSGPDRVKLEMLADGDKRIKFLGFVPDEKLCDFYNSLDLFCFPTACEGVGLPILEAMACKKEVLIEPNTIAPLDIKRRCRYIGPHVFEYFRYFSDLSSSRVARIESNYSFAKSLTWDKFIDGLEVTIKEVLND